MCKPSSMHWQTQIEFYIKKYIIQQDIKFEDVNAFLKIASKSSKINQCEDVNKT